MNAKTDNQRILTPEFRVSYPHVFKPNQYGTAAPKYSITMLFPKDTDLKILSQAIHAAKVAKFGADKSKWPKLASPVSDGDNAKYAGKEGHQDHWVIKATSNEDNKPGVVDNSGKRLITDVAEFYPGCYARAYIYAYVWEFMGKQGVSFILDHVQKLRDGKSFSSKKPADQVFSPVENNEQDGEEDISFMDEQEEDVTEVPF